MPSTSDSPENSNTKPFPWKKRPYAQACLACRSRKIRCVEMDSPPCKGCRNAGIPCQFPEGSVRRKRRPPTSQPATAVAATAVSNDPSASESTPDSLLKSQQQADLIERRLRRIEHALHLAPLSIEALAVKDSNSSMSEDEIEPPRFSLSGNQNSTYHGETSMYEDANSDRSPANASSAKASTSVDVANWSHQEIRSLTRLRHKYASPDEGEALMDAYFCWASASTGVVNRRLFLRDMAVQGPFYSDLLLLIIYQSGLRFSPDLSPEERKIKSERYTTIVMSLIAEELCKPCSIPTAQALLSLAGTRCANGDMTQAWLFSGLAIRMIQDLGIHLAIDDPSLDAHLDQEIRDVRVRLYWAAYCWDKQISMGMGREPALTGRSDPSVVKINVQDDDWEWRPFIPGNLELMLNYPPTWIRTAYVMQYNCRLNMQLESILYNMYSPTRPHARSFGFVREADERLRRWRDELPDDIRLDRETVKTLEFCPPINIVNINLLYNVVRILLFRPLLTVRNQPSGVTQTSFDVCRSAALDIHEILSLWGRGFGMRNMVYLIMYTTFVTAGVDVILLKVGDAQTREEALKRVHLSLSILERASHQGPGIRRGISIIHSQLQAAMQRQQSNGHAMGPVTGSTLVERNYGDSLRHAQTGGSSAPVSSERGGEANKAVFEFGAVAHDGVSNQEALAQPFAFEYQPADVISPVLFDDPQALADLLGESNVGTDDPFAFLSADGWDELKL